jgi:ATPase subunit of ABC transporter with duplicated ATPase domains
LITAINDFKGAVIIVSHDIYFMKRLEDFHIYELKNKNLNRIDDDVDNYLDKLEENMIKEEKEKMSNEEKEKIKKIEKMKNKKVKK